MGKELKITTVRCAKDTCQKFAIDRACQAGNYLKKRNNNT